jgi:hypothetical protein
MAAAPALGCNGMEMEQSFTGIGPHPLVQSILALLGSNNGRWVGTATGLLDLLPPSKEYRTPKGISQRIRSLAPLLASAGIRTEFRRLAGGRMRSLSLDVLPR